MAEKDRSAKIDHTKGHHGARMSAGSGTGKNSSKGNKGGKK